MSADARVLRVDAAATQSEIIEAAAACIRAGGIVAFPTDTLYGLAASPFDEAAVQKVLIVKRRPAGQPLPLIAASLETAERAGHFTALARRLAEGFWPGPLTILVPADSAIVRDVHQGTGRVGIRVPDHAVARALAAASGGLITATSANRSGEPPAERAETVVHLAAAGVELVLDAGPVAGGPPSTIVDAAGDRPVLVRAGAVPWERVLEFVR
ncbi:MAG TPA: L-threonylcarbamoyladenylate synthase [Vicinamibacterales bacterium]|nr:L-threonylcarbamoyladenylate synthase [Vicinamibacterales bacterium]